MYKFKSSPYLNIKKKVENYTSLKFQCINLEKELLNFINLIRREPSKIIEYFQEVQQDPNYNNNFETQQIFNFINNLTKNNISLPPLIEKQEINKISFDLLNYLINVKKIEGRIKYNNLDEEYINFKIRAAPYGRIRGKYYEAIVLDSTNLLEIISYIMKDIKGRNVLFNEKIKYIGIACGFFENINDNKNNIYNNAQNNKICTIIDMVQDFELNDISINNNNRSNNNNYNDVINKNKTPEIFMRIKTIFKDKDQLMKNNNKNTEKSLSVDNTDRIKRYHKLKKDNYNEEQNKNSETKRIIVNKSPLLSNNKKYMKTFSSKFYIRKANTNKPKPKIISYKSNIKNRNKNKIKKLPSFTNISYKNKNNNIDEANNIYRNNSIYFSSQFNFTKKKEKQNNNNYNDNNSSSKHEINSVSRNKSSKKKLNREEKIELLKQINKASRDKSNKDKKTKSNIKSDDDSKSVSFTTKKNISNDISFSELISYDNDKKLKEEKEMKNLKNQIKNEIKKEIKEAKEEIKNELVNKILSSTSHNIKYNLPNLKLKLPINNNINNMNINDNTYDYGVINNTYTNPSIDGKNIDINTNRSISSIDIFFPPNNKNLTSNNNNDNLPEIINYPQMNDSNYKKDNFIMKKLVKLYNVMNKNEIDNKQLSNNKSFNNQKNKNIYHKIPILKNRIYGNNNIEPNYIYNNYYKKNNNIIKKNNKIIKIDNIFDNQNQSVNNFKSISPKRRNNISRLPFRKIIVKNNINNAPRNDKISYEKIIKIPKKIINDVNYLDKNNIIINNKTNNIVYIKQISPIRNAQYSGRRIYENKTNYFNKLNQNNQ